MAEANKVSAERWAMVLAAISSLLVLSVSDSALSRLILLLLFIASSCRWVWLGASGRRSGTRD